MKELESGAVEEVRMGADMRELIVRGFDAELEQQIRAFAEREGISLSQAVLRMLRMGAARIEVAGERSGSIGRGLDKYVGTWTREQTADVERAVADFEQIDDSFWDA